MPTSIPPFSNVPAPGDDVQSAWAQQLTQYAVDHVNDGADAHDASAISFNPLPTVDATTVQAAIEEVVLDGQAAIYVHATDTTDAHIASAISFVPTGAITATNVQDAIIAVEGGALSAHLIDASDAHAASAIAFTASGPLTATQVQTAIDQLVALLPRGFVGQAVNANPTTVPNAPTDILNAFVTWTADASRIYKITATFGMRASASGTGIFFGRITDAANTVWASNSVTLEADNNGSLMLLLVVSGLSGSVTRKLRGQMSVGTASVGGYPETTILVEDIGAV